MTVLRLQWLRGQFKISPRPGAQRRKSRVAGANVIYKGLRREIDLGIDSNGDTVVILPNTHDNNGPGGSILEFGSSHVLAGSDSGYNTFQLVYDPATNLANLFVNGIEEIVGYTGDTAFVENWGLFFGAFSGGQGNFNLVELSSGLSPSVPEPSGLAILASALVCLIGVFRFSSLGVIRPMSVSGRALG